MVFPIMCVLINTFNPLARLIARSGLSTRKTRNIFTTEIALELNRGMEIEWRFIIIKKNMMMMMILP